VHGSHITLAVDGHTRVDFDDSDFSSGTRVGLFSTASEIEISSFEVIGQ
jgi:hypothetical protein